MRLNSMMCCIRQVQRGGFFVEGLPDLRQPSVVGCVRVGARWRNGCDPQAGGVCATHPTPVLQPCKLAELRQTG